MHQLWLRTILNVNQSCPDKSGMMDASAMVENNFECESEPSLDKSNMVDSLYMIENKYECESEPCPDKSGTVESNSTEEPSLSQVISIESVNFELRHNDHVITELQSKIMLRLLSSLRLKMLMSPIWK